MAGMVRQQIVRPPAIEVSAGGGLQKPTPPRVIYKLVRRWLAWLPWACSTSGGVVRKRRDHRDAEKGCSRKVGFRWKAEPLLWKLVLLALHGLDDPCLWVMHHLDATPQIAQRGVHGLGLACTVKL